MKIIGLTMAKGTSSRLPMKNMLLFAGRPLVEWTLIAMKASRYLTDFWMVTDSQEVAELSERYHFRVVFQSAESAKGAGYFGGPICMNLFIAASKYEDGDVIASGLPTSPCRKPGDIDAAVAEYLRQKCAHPDKEVSVTSLCRRKDLALMEEKDGQVKMAIFDNQAKYLTTNGSIGVGSYGLAKQNAERWARMHEQYVKGKHYPKDMTIQPSVNTYVDNEPWQQWDIDRVQDFELCEQLFVANGLGAEAYARYNLGRE